MGQWRILFIHVYQVQMFIEHTKISIRNHVHCITEQKCNFFLGHLEDDLRNKDHNKYHNE